MFRILHERGAAVASCLIPCSAQLVALFPGAARRGRPARGGEHQTRDGAVAKRELLRLIRAASRCGKLGGLTLSLSLITPVGQAGEVDMRDFIRLSEGMSEAEIIYRIGQPDYETVYTEHHHSAGKIWYYIPQIQTSGTWITEIEFNRHGTVIKLTRSRPR